MAQKQKPSVSISFPSVPKQPNASDVIIAMGRLTMAWSSSEFYLAMLLSRLMATADLSTPENIQKALEGNAVVSFDANGVFALYFAVESSRGRRKLVQDLADARNGEGYLTKTSLDEIKTLLRTHSDLAQLRNRYAHTAMGQTDDGSYILLDGKMMISRVDGSRMQRSAKIRANNNKVNAKMIDEVTDRLSGWIDDARSLLSRISTSTAPGLSPPTAT